MSLIRQVWLLLLVTVLLALVGGAGVTVFSARDALQTQVRIKNSDNASALALAVSQQRGDAVAIELLLASQFDTGFYRQMRWTDLEGRVLFERQADEKPTQAPDWFRGLVRIQAEEGVAQLSDGWRALGRLQVQTQTAYAYDDLWRATLRATALLGSIGLLAGLLATWVVRSIARALDAVVDQARALLAGRFVTVPEPSIPELQRLSRAMNAMVGRLKLIFESQAEQVETMRRQAVADPLTGLPKRSHFLARLQADLQRDDGPTQVSLVLLRIGQLADLNRALGHAATDRLIGSVANTLSDYAEKVRGSLVGRLNGSDFALCLPVGGVAQESGLAIAQALQVVLPNLSPSASVALGTVELDREQVRAAQGLGAALGLADAALASAEAAEPFSVHRIDLGLAQQAGVAMGGERAWRQHILEALSRADRMRLDTFPVLRRNGDLMHLECPMRLQLLDQGAFEPAAFWLPLALRSRATMAADEQAVVQALALCARDGFERGVNLSHASLVDTAFVRGLRDRLQADVRSARLLWLEVPEIAAIEHFGQLQRLSTELRPLGVRVGLEHAGLRLREIPALYEAGLDFVKLDASMGLGLAHDAQRQGFLQAMVTMLHGLAIQVVAEGVSHEEDAAALWECGVDGLTGPWASRQQRVRPATWR